MTNVDQKPLAIEVVKFYAKGRTFYEKERMLLDFQRWIEHGYITKEEIILAIQSAKLEMLELAQKEALEIQQRLNDKVYFANQLLNF